MSQKTKFLKVVFLRFLAILCIFMATTAIKAEQFGGFFENIYDELQMLKLSKEQENALKNIIKNHHKFLRQWYSDERANKEKMMRNFANSSLKSNAPEFAQDKSLMNDRICAEHKFMMSVYEILDAQQRHIFSTKINEKAESKATKKPKKEGEKGFVKYGE